MLLMFQIIISRPIFDSAVNFGVDHIQDMIFMESFALVALLAVLRVMTEKILINRNAIVRTTIL